jgi:hypothetical protein
MIMQVLRFGLVFGLLMGAACLDSTAPKDNDGQWTPPVTGGDGDGDGNTGNDNTGGGNPGGGNTGGGSDNTGGGNTGGGNTGGGDTGGGNTNTGGGSSGGDSPGGDNTGDNTGGGSSGGDNTGGGDNTDGGNTDEPGQGGDGDGDTGPSALEQIAGTGKNCLTYQAKSGDKCAGVYCGISQDLLAQALTETQNFPNDCGSVPADLLCSGVTVTQVGMCARSVKSANITKSNAELRPLIQECVYKNAEIKAKMPPACLGCYLTSAECSGEKCLLQCLSGDSPNCDKCRLDNGCSRPVAKCTGFPDPL